MSMRNSYSRKSGLGQSYKLGNPRILAFFILIGILGAWLNAQGGWVKDFSYQKTVVLPLLFHNYTTSGFSWYLVGIFDDLGGFFSNLIGIYGFRRISKLDVLSVYSRKYFLIPVAVYLITDFFAFLNFNNYYSGVTTLSDYGLYWNILQYFIMIPCFILADLFLLLYTPAADSKK